MRRAVQYEHASSSRQRAADLARPRAPCPRTAAPLPAPAALGGGHTSRRVDLDPASGGARSLHDTRGRRGWWARVFGPLRGPDRELCVVHTLARAHEKVVSSRGVPCRRVIRTTCAHAVLQIVNRRGACVYVVVHSSDRHPSHRRGQNTHTGRVLLTRSLYRSQSTLDYSRNSPVPRNTTLHKVCVQFATLLRALCSHSAARYNKRHHHTTAHAHSAAHTAVPLCGTRQQRPSLETVA